ncbi:glycine--tRNA ligase [candidate division KSB1 bacterium]|nr:glycine--tRNA ligase [candidate division KSB1 bacterium]MBL7095258.1 glycine--tRNA ligase [candidate division KSB1 bacterium]
MEKIVSLCKRKGFIFQSSEIYGGIASCYDYGPLGIELKKNIKEMWWKSMVQFRRDVEGLDAAILMAPQVWEASGHVEGFTDPLVDCKECKHRFRADQLEDVTKCPDCGGELTEERQFNLMFKTHMGPLEDQGSLVYMRPETAQGIYVNFLNVQKASRQKVPFGIAQIGKAFRNEITPGNFTFRTREFEQMEMQFFVKPGTDQEWFEFWKEERMKWYDFIGVTKEKLRFHEHGKDELAHYAKTAYDIEYEFPFGTMELEGIHNRTDFDLTRHKEFSGKDMSYFDDETRERYIPYIIETSAGVDRTLLTCLIDAYEEEQLEKDTRVVLHLSPKIAPIKAAVFPLVKRDGMPEMAQKIVEDIRPHYMAFYDQGGAVGRRYRRMDEVGTPYCITVDTQTLEDQTVTIRDRDSMKQDRISIDKIKEYLDERILFVG